MLPRRPTPPQDMPTVDLEEVPPEPNTSPVIFDVLERDNQPSTGSVALITGSSTATGFASNGYATATSYGYAESERFLCRAPCVVNLPIGDHMVRFSRSSDGGTQYMSVHASRKHAMVYRASPGKTTSHIGGLVAGILLVSFGGTGALTGFALAPVVGGAGVGVGLGGLAMAIVGGLVWNSSRTEIELGESASFAAPTSAPAMH